MVFVMLVGLSSYLLVGHASATAGILDTRSVKMSSSAAGSISAGQNVSYAFQFNIGTTGNIGEIALLFCDQSPIPGDSNCSNANSFSWNKATIGNPTNQNLAVGTPCGVSNWTTDTSANSTNQYLLLTRASATSVNSGCTMTFTLGNGSTTGVTNPNTHDTSFYIRILTFATTTGGVGGTAGSPGSYVDFGGIAETTTSQLSITAKVQETLSLCVYISSCSTGTGSNTVSITLGTSGIIDASAIYTNNQAHFQASTNATNGMTVYAQGTTLTSPQANTIAPINAGASTPISPSAGTEQFGFCVSMTTGSGQAVVASAPYSGGTGSCSSAGTGANTAGTAQFAFQTTGGTNMTSSGGMPIASSSGPSTTTTGTLAYVADASTVTKAGSYSTTQTFIGVGSF